MPYGVPLFCRTLLKKCDNMPENEEIWNISSAKLENRV